VLSSELRLGPEERRACYEDAIQLGRFDIGQLKPAAAATPPDAGARPGPAGGSAGAAVRRKVPALTRSRERDGTP
jgi:hypothetical protein